MPQEAARLTHENLPVALMANVALAAILATMLVRFHWFRRILLTEKRDWQERLAFSVGLGVPLVAGVVVRLLLDYEAADLTLSGAYLAELNRRAVCGRPARRSAGVAALFAGELGALPFAVGCGFAGGGLRRSARRGRNLAVLAFFVTKLHRSVWRLVRSLQLDWQVILVMAPVLLELVRQTSRQPFPLQHLRLSADHWWCACS
jgi:two-component system LytT family sensor kinase